MTAEGALGPLLADGTVAPIRQTRLGWFLVSAYGALARLAAAQSLAAAGPGSVVMQAAATQAAGVAGAVMRGTAWQPDLWPLLRLAQWELGWLASTPLDAAALGLAIVTVVRPAPLLPANIDRAAPFAVALALAELESGRLLQPFLHQLQALVPQLPRATVEEAAERRRVAVGALWQDVIEGLSAT